MGRDDKCYDKSKMKLVVGNLGAKKFDYIHCNICSKVLLPQVLKQAMCKTPKQCLYYRFSQLLA